MGEDYRIVAARAGGPEVLTIEPIARPEPGTGEVLVRHVTVGVNFVDTYHRSGLYSGAMPTPIGSEAAEIIEAVGAGVRDVHPGDRVAYATGGLGAYATVRTMPADHVVRLPTEVSEGIAAAAMLKGMTAACLLGPCAKVRAGQVVLVHAAAGGVGSILVQWLRALGAVVIGHAGSAAKADRTASLGAHYALDCPMDALPGEVRRITAGAGADIVLDGVGAASWAASLAATAPCGLLVTYGNASGSVPAFTALDLMTAGSVFVTRPTLRHYAATPDRRRALAAALFAQIAAGTVRIDIRLSLPLARAADAHRALEARETTGSTILTVGR